MTNVTKSRASNNIFQHIYQHAEFWTFLYSMRQLA